MLVVAASAVSASSQIPHSISYQGVLTDGAGTPVADGPYSITFNFYHQESGGSPIWTQTTGVTVTGGIFNVTLGEFPAEFFELPTFLGVVVEGGQEMTPRRALLSSPYALNSVTVQDSSINQFKIANGAVVRSLNGVADDVFLVGGANISIDPMGSSIIISSPGGGGLGGTGTAGQVAFWSAPTTLSGENNLFWDSTNKRLGIGTPNPNARLRVESSEQYTAVFSGDNLSDNSQVIRANFVGTGTGYDPVAVYGRSHPADGYGYGGKFEGGRGGIKAVANGGTAGPVAVYGVLGEASGSGTGGRRYGARGDAFGPNADHNIGVAGFASGSPTSSSIGVWGDANTANARIGVYGSVDAVISYSYGVMGFAPIHASTAAVVASGDIQYSGSLIGPVSDVNAKRNSQAVDGVLSRVMQIEPKTFEYKFDDPDFEGINLSPGQHFGIMAQDLETIFPELVVTRSYPRSLPHEEKEAKPPLELKSVNYIELVPILVQAIKEQQQTIEALSARVAQLENR